MPMLSPIRTAADTATDRTNLANTLTTLEGAITTHESLFTGATPPLAVPSEFADIRTTLADVMIELATLSGA